MDLIRIPKFSENMDEATIVEWMKSEGDPIEQGDHLLTVITDKADVEIEAEAAGTLLKIVAEEKSSVPVSYIVGLIGSPSDELPDYESMNDEARAQFTVGTEGLDSAAKPKKRPSKPAQRSARVAATPKAKRLAKKNSIDLAAVQEFAKADGPVTEDMVQAFIESAE
jgi:pyruvate dehydrogenase E2 component (dihydrolipoamide acetyltransferase)